MKKNSFIKWILLGVDVIVIGLLIFTYYNWRQNNNKDNVVDDIIEPTDDTQEITYNDVTFKKFTFNIPSDIDYSVLDDYRFNLKTSSYNTNVELFLHGEENLMDYPDLYYEELIDAGLKVSKPEKIKVGIIDVIKYSYTDEDNDYDALYYFKYDDSFDCELELKDTGDNLARIMNVLLNAEYDNEDTEKYIYHVWKFDDDKKS